MPNKVIYDDDARAKVLAGAKLLYDAVKTTMGPKGRNVVISRPPLPLTITHDGVTVAKAMDIKETEENMGIKAGGDLIKQAASKMNDVAGDGTTTVTVLTYHILNEANKLIAAGYNPMLLRRELEQAGDSALALIDGFSTMVEDSKTKLAQVATISAGSKEVGDLVAEVMSKVGKDGVVTVEEGQGLALESEVVKGFIADRGYISPYMATDTSRMEAIYGRPAVIITDQRLSSVQEVVPLIEKLAQAGKKDLLLIAEDVEGDVLSTLILNRLKGVFNTVAVRAPSFGDERAEVLEDIAILTGAQVIGPNRGTDFSTVGLEVVGSARKVIVNKDTTTIVEGAGDTKELTKRLLELDHQIDKAKSEHAKERLQTRKAALQGKVAIIKIGGATETEIEEEKFRVDDAVAATKAAMAEGVVLGGGTTMVRISNLILPDDAGSRLLIAALQEPFKQLMENSGFNGEAMLEKLQNSPKLTDGFDVRSTKPELIDIHQAGILDPTTVLIEAIQNAVSIAGTAITMGALIVDIPEKNDQVTNLMQP